MSFLMWDRRKMSEQANNIKFVEEVEKHPCLYDFTLVEYTRKDITEEAWSHVGKLFNLTGSQSKEKWRNLRNVFARNLKLKPGQKKPYYLAEAMRFAVPFIKTQAPKRERLQLSDAYDDTDSEAAEENICELNSPRTIKPSTSPQSYSPPPSPRPSESNKRRLQSKDRTENEDFLEHSKPKKANVDKTDPTKIAKRMFLLSLLPDFYSMDDAQTRHFRIRVLTLIDEILMSNSSFVRSVKIES